MQNVHLSLFRSLCLASLLILSSCHQDPLTIFVSPDGSDTNRGTKSSPLRTFEEARSRAAKLLRREDLKADTIRVLFRRGVYPVSKTLELGFIDAGSAKTAVKYGAFQGEEVRFSGGRDLIPSDFRLADDPEILKRIIDKEARERVLACNLKELGIDSYGKLRQHGFSTAILPVPIELFVNNEPMVLARYPNEGRLPVSGVLKNCSRSYEGDLSVDPGIISYDFDRPDYWSEADDLWLRGYFAAGFADDNLGVASIDTGNKALILKHAHMFGMVPSDPSAEWGAKIVGYYAYNLPEELDVPGEYYIDPETGILYVYPPDGFEASRITISILEDPLLAIENSAHITLEGITFECARGMGVYMENSENILFDRCIFRNLGTLGVMFGKGVAGADFPIHEFTGFMKSRTIGNLKAHVYENTQFSNQAGKNCGLSNCEIYHTGSGAVVLSGGDRRTLEPAGNFIINSVLHDFNRWNMTYCAGITLYGVGNIIRNCHIYNAPHQGIAIFGNEHLIELNHLEKLVMDVHDNGAIYIGRNPSERGNVIRNNYFSRMGREGFKNCAIHLDDLASGTLVEGNVFYRASRSDFGDILINGGSQNTIRNNVFMEGSHVLWIEDPNLAIPPEVFSARYGMEGLMGKRLYSDIDIRSEVWKSRYPGFSPYGENQIPYVLKDNQFYKNCMINSQFIISKHDLDQGVFSRYQDNHFSETIREDSSLGPEALLSVDTIDLSDIIPGFEPIPIAKMIKH